MIQASLDPLARRKSIHPMSLVAVLVLLLGAGARAAEPTASLTVTFHGLKTTSGEVRAALDASPDAWAGAAPPAAQVAVAVTGDVVRATFTGLKPGTYAIRAFHDLNGDGKLNTNPFGIPTEPYAFSNNAAGVMGPPAWAAASFAVVAGDNGQTIDID